MPTDRDTLQYLLTADVPESRAYPGGSANLVDGLFAIALALLDLSDTLKTLKNPQC